MTLVKVTLESLERVKHLKNLYNIMYVFPGHQQSTMIAHGLCKNLPNFTSIENQTSSWCPPKIFEKDFRVNVHCPCFIPKI